MAAVTQEQYQDVLKQFADLRVEVANQVGQLTGALNVTNTRLNDLIDSLEKQGSSRRWAIGTFGASVGIAISLAALVVAIVFHL